jgi:hypothetical protein
MSQTSDPHDPVSFVIIAVLGVMVIIALHLIRHPPDDGLVEAKIATFDGFWQFQTLDTGLSCSQPATLAAERRKCRICCHPDAPLPWVSLERMTIKDFTRVLDQAAAAVPRSAAGCRQTNFSGWVE